jgi:zinc protease
MSRAVQLISEMLKKPLFEKNAVQREIERYLEILKERSYSPERLAYDNAVAALYGEHPYASAGNGKLDDIAGLTRKKLQDFYNRCRSAGKRVFGFSGDCSAEEVKGWSEILDSALGKYSGILPRPENPVFPEKTISRQFSLQREQTVVLRMIPGVGSVADEALELMEILIHAENGLSSELFKTVREDHALSYSVGMNFTAGFHTGAICFYAMTAAGAEEKVMELLNAEIKRLAEAGLSGEEFAAAQKCMLFELGKVFDSCESLIKSAAMDVYYDKCPLGICGRRKKIAELTVEEFNRGIRSYFLNAAGVEVTVSSED